MAESPYDIIHTVRHVQHHASPLPLPAPNIRHQVSLTQPHPHAHISGRTTFFRINPDLLHVPRSSSGTKGGDSILTEFPATPFARSP
jgi:hypothetical protein